jgi:hypothetical protein
VKPKNEKNRRSLISSLIFFILALIAGKALLAQGTPEDDFVLHHLGVQLTAGMMPRAEVKSNEGTYKLHSGLQPSFDAAVYYKTNNGAFWTYAFGLGLTFIASRYNLHIPDADLTGFPSTQGAPQIEEKQVYFQLKIPFRLAYKFRHISNGYWSTEGGFDFKYSGFSTDETVTMSMANANGQQQAIYAGSFSSNNNHKPWFTATLAVARAIITGRSSSIILQTFIEGSITHSIHGEYQITVPGKPVARGNIFFRESRIGLSLEYCFAKRSH